MCKWIDAHILKILNRYVTKLERRDITMLPQQQNCIDNALYQRCKELKKECMSYIKNILDEMLEQVKKYERILLYDLIDNGDLELPDKECEEFVMKFIHDNEKMALDIIIGNRVQEFLDKKC